MTSGAAARNGTAARALYRCVVRLHPAAFRERFAEEMLWIFDESAAERSLPRLLGDGIASLGRQWILRSGMWTYGAGAFLSALLMFGFVYSLQTGWTEAFRRADSRRYAQFLQLLRSEKVFAAGFAPARENSAASGAEEWTMRPVEASPRMAALERRLDAGDRSALAGFWDDVASRGTPLIERASDAPNAVIATFLWHGDANTENVRLLASLGDARGVAELPLVNLRGTNVWYGSWEMSKEFRFAYCVVVNLKFDRDSRDRRQVAGLDPLNPNQVELLSEAAGQPAPSGAGAEEP